MRIVSFGPPRQERPGVLLDDATILDLQSADSTLPGTWGGILAAQRLANVQTLVAAARNGGAAAGARLRRGGLRLGPPIPDPSKIVCVGLNYADHAAEQNKPLPETPLLFAKATTALAGDGDVIVLPEIESQVDIEAELAFVVGRDATQVRAADAAGFILGYMCFNDVSGRHAQYSDKQWFRGKSFDTFAPCGPWLSTADEIADPHALAIGSQIDDFVLQQSCTDQLVHRVPQLLEYITRSMTLRAGDIVATGTPAGVGVFREPPIFLRDGQRVRIRIEGLGVLENPVRAAHPNRR